MRNTSGMHIIKNRKERDNKMISACRITVMNLDNAIRGMRNPLNSWHKSDSYYDDNGNYILGECDLSLAMRLANAGSDDRKYLRQILVSIDIEAPFLWWKEFDTYKVATVSNSCSTMHRLHTRYLTIDDFTHESLDEPGLQLLQANIDYINHNRRLYIATNDKKYWRRMIEMLGTNYNQLRTVTLNYEVLRNMYHARKNHKLQEWKDLCKIIESLPYSQLITGEEAKWEGEDVLSLIKENSMLCGARQTLIRCPIFDEIAKAKADTVNKLQTALTTFFANDEILKYNEVDADYINEQINKIINEFLEGKYDRTTEDMGAQS